MTIRKSLVAALILFLGLAVLINSHLPEASAEPKICTQYINGRCLRQGYFTGDENQDPQLIMPLGNYFRYEDVWPDGAGPIGDHWAFPKLTGPNTHNAVYTKTFLNLVHSYLFDDYNCNTPDMYEHTDPYTNGTGLSVGSECFQTRRDAVGAATYVNLAMGFQGSDFGPGGTYNDAGYKAAFNQGVLKARASFDDFAKIIRYYDSVGQINWNAHDFGAEGHLNSSGSNYGTETEFFANPNPGNFNAIRITDADGNVLQTINRSCGNMTNKVGPIPPPPSDQFTVTAAPEVKLSPDEENPSKAKFILSPSTTNAPLKNIDFTESFYVLRLGSSTKEPLGPDPTLTFNNRDFTTSDLELIDPPPERSLPGDLEAGDRVCMDFTISPRKGTVDDDGDILTVTDASFSDSECTTVVNKPYTKFLGNDLYVGGSFGASGCTPMAPASLYAYSRPEGSGIVGSSAQFAAYVMEENNGVPTASMGGSLPIGLGLSFANNSTTAPITQPGFGGGFGGSNCVHNFLADQTGANEVPDSDHYTIPQNLASGKYFLDPPASSGQIVKLTADLGTITDGSHLFFYVDGNVYIPSNIVYANTAWTSAKKIPVLYIVASGNIYVGPGVTRLDGVYVAQSSYMGYGTFYSCAGPTGAYPDPTKDINSAKNNFLEKPGTTNCNSNTLTVNGAVIARQIRLLRTKYSLRNGVTNEQASHNRASEYFVFSPELYMADICDIPSFCGQANGDDSITSLPPIL